jgi:hypothetical protein
LAALPESIWHLACAFKKAQAIGGSPHMQSIWPQVVVALGLFALMGTITVVAMFRYPQQPDQVLRIWNAQVGLLGAVVGMIATYFFTQASLTESRNARELVQTVAAEQREVATRALKDNARLTDELGDVHRTLSRFMLGRGVSATQPWESPAPSDHRLE